MQSAASAGAGRTDRPRFRQDLVAETVEDQGARFIDVMAPESGSLYRFYEVEYSLACGMDGERDVAGIVKWAHDELGLAASAQEVKSVIATLGSLGFIGDDASEQPELAAGVVAAAAEAPAVAHDVELGAAGTSAPARREPQPATPNLTLGASGGGAQARKPSEPSEDVALGAPGRSARATPAPPVGEDDVSLDLADHMAVRRDDVKEAVRASRVMSAVEVPQDLLEALEDRPTPKPEPIAAPVRPIEVAKSEPRVAARVEPPAPMRVAPRVEPASEPRAAESARLEQVKPVEAPVVAKPVEVAAGAVAVAVAVAAKADAVGKSPVAAKAKPAVELPKPVATSAEKAAVPPAPKSGVSPALVVILILAVLGGAAFFVWKYVLEKPAGDADTSTQPATPAVKPEVAQPAPPVVVAPTAKIAMETPVAEDIKLASAGVVETILADKSVVKPGDVIVKLVGDKPVEAELAALNKDLATIGTKREAVTKKLEAAGDNQAVKDKATADLAALDKTQGTKQELLAAKTTELDKFQIHAKTGGTFSPVAKQGAKLAADAVVAKLQADATPTATFKLVDTKAFAANASVDVGVGSGEQHVSCTVADVQADSVKVTCPVDAALTDGADVTLKLPGAAAAGSAAPAAGSAEAPAAVPAGSGSAEAPAAGSDSAPAK